MESEENTGARTFELALSVGETPEEPGPASTGSLPEELLAQNVTWYCWLRWVVVAILVGYGLPSYVPGLYARFGLRAPVQWPLWAAAALVVMNLAYLFHARRWVSAGRPHASVLSLWVQIILDLLVLGIVVHCAGTRATVAHLAFLFHIVLACIFFRRSESLLVTLFACLVFTGWVAVEIGWGIRPGTVYAGVLPIAGLEGCCPHFLGKVVSTQAIWVGVWFLASHVSALIRARDRALAEANALLVAAREEKTRHMLVATHELKAPFAAIHANAHLLAGGYCGVLPDKALEVATRIAARSRRLATEIRDMLELAQLQSPAVETPPVEDIDLCPIVRQVISQAEPAAEDRNIVIVQQLGATPLVVTGIPEHLRMLLQNLVVNAVTYSFEGGQVEIGGRRDGNGAAVLTIADHGLGIPAEKLPHIFDEYFRTEDAVRHCRESTGLGLAIVRRVALSHRVQLRVTSQAGEGTSFELGFPPPEGH